MSRAAAPPHPDAPQAPPPRGRTRRSLQWPLAPPSRVRRALTGAIAAAAGLAASSLISAVFPGGVSAVAAVGDEVVSLTPAGTREAAIGALGSADKPFILLSVAGVTIAMAALLGLAARRDRVPLAIGGAALLAISLAATGVSSPAALPAGLVATLGAAIAAAWTVGRLTRPAPVPQTAAAERTPPAAWHEKEMSRRQFTALAATFAAVAALGQGLSSLLGGFSSSAVDAFRVAVRLPRVARPLPAPAAADSFDVPGISPLVTPNGDFYRVDTAFIPPALDPGTWRLRIDGMVRHPMTLSYDDLMKTPQVEADITLCCVSDPVGGNLISNARWQGVRLDRLLGLAGVLPGADQIVGRSADGFTAGMPTRLALDGRASLVAVAMNGQPLPIEHGFPARLVVPGLYGYVSATKWLTEIQLTTFASFDAYWVQRGWAQPAPLVTESRIDVPQSGSRVNAGAVTIAGVAWAQHRGISGVQVRVDSGPWLDAEVAGELSIDTWRQWRVRWLASAGTHLIEVRARDATGAVQSPRESDPFPSGATGYHTVQVTVA